MYLNDRLVARGAVTLLGPDPTATSTSSSSTSAPTTASTTSATAYPHSQVSPAASTSSAASTTDRAAASSGSGLKTGPIIGIVIGSVGFVIICAALIFFFCRRRTFKKNISSGSSIDRGMSTTPMIGSQGQEKYVTDESPDLEQNGGETRGGGGVFAAFGGYQRTASRELVEPTTAPEVNQPQETNPVLDISNYDSDIGSVKIKCPEKRALAKLRAPPDSEHPAYHPLPGQTENIPTYYPGVGALPVYTRSHLPSQRGRHTSLPDVYPDHAPPRPPFATHASHPAMAGSPQIPDLLFSPIALVPNTPVGHLDDVPVTPQAELAAFPTPPTTIPSHYKMIAKTIPNEPKKKLTPPPLMKDRPRRQHTPPRNSAPLGRLTPPNLSTLQGEPAPNSAPTIQRGSNPMKSFTGLQISGLHRKPTGKPPSTGRPKATTYPSPTAGGRPELPASFPSPKRPTMPKSMPSVQKTPRHMVATKVMPAFHHISLPSPSSPASSTLGRNESTNTTYSIPIGLDSKSRRPSEAPDNDWPLTNFPVTSDAHHLRNQPSAISALSAVRDLQNSSAVSAMSSLSPGAMTPGGGLKHNHSREFEHADAHVTSWQQYDGNGEGEEDGVVHEMGDGEMGMNQRLMGGGWSEPEVSPMFSPPIDGLGNAVVSPMTMGMKTPGIGGYGGGGGYGVVSPMASYAKTPSQQSLDEREREREEYFGDLSVQPLNMGQRIMGRWSMKGSARQSRSRRD